MHQLSGLRRHAPAQTVVCNRHHSLEQQLCRWLLLSVDRLPSNTLQMTEELIANMPGVPGEGAPRRPACCRQTV
jgi:hypothetical protein